MDDNLDALERLMLANLLEGRQPRRRATIVPKSQRNSDSRQSAPQQRTASRNAPARAAIPSPSASHQVPDLRANRQLDIGRVIKQIDPRTTPEWRSEMAAAWVRLDLTAAQVHAWLTAGLLPAQHELAKECIARGLTPADMKSRIDGVRVVERLRGDGVDGVVDLLRSNGWQPTPRPTAAA
ncbi:hypothetical protein [Yinghuangia seranimata]|uniref:hypothetical protein n=1 Tax=Yinghuangia seranimata TaxID=408067 RepID=UPI00248C8555|nr:hypothetical protein [Yinghuangia seranimata]MDI2132146.1 hypothetical protein [Yinghuangia seranimata]